MTSRFIINVMVAMTVLIGLGVCANMATAETVTFQDGTLTPTEAGGTGEAYEGTTDLHLREANLNQDHYNTGGEYYLVVGQYGTGITDDTRPLTNFDYGTLTDYMQTNGLRIQSATLQLYLEGCAGSATTGVGQTVDLFKGLTAFNEGTGAHRNNGRDGRLAQTGESCWRKQTYNTVDWAGGGLHSSADWGVTLDTGIVLSPAKYGSWIDFDVTGAYADDGSDLSAQNGFCMLARHDDDSPYYDGSGANQMLFRSSNSSEAEKPILTFVLVPEPSTFVLAGFGLLSLLAYAWRKRK